MRKLFVTLAVISIVCTTAAVSPSSAQTPEDSAPAPVVVLEDVLDLLTYRVHTVFDRPNGPDLERTVGALVGVPQLVNVDGGVLPDLVVEILPLPPNLITVTFTRLPTTLGPLPTLAEVLVDVPDGTGAAFGFDARQGRTPPVFNGAFTFGLGGGGTNINASANTAFPSTTPTLAVVAAFFTKGPNGGRIDPTSARADLTPVPGSLQIGVDAVATPGAPRLDVNVKTSSPTTVDLDATTVAGPVERQFTGTVATLPDSLTVSVTGNGQNRHHIDYDASDPIERVDVDFFERKDGVLTRHVTGKLTDVPTVIDADVETNLVVVDDDVAETARLELTAGDPVGMAELGFNKVETTPLASEITEPLYAVADLDSEGDNGVQRAAVRAPGVESILADTSDPLVVNVTSAGGPMRAEVTDTRTEGDTATMVATLNDLPRTVGVQFSPSAGTLSYDGDSIIDVATFDLRDPEGIGSTSPQGPVSSPHGVVPTVLAARVEGIPGAIDVTFKPSGPSPVGRPLLTFDAPGGVGLVQVLLTNGPLPSTPIPAGADGATIEDFENRFVTNVAVSGLEHLLVQTGGPFQDRPGPVDARPVARVEVNTTTNNRFFARLDRATPGGDEFVEADISQLAPNLSVDLFNFDRIPCDEVEDDENSDGGGLFADGCRIFDREEPPRVLILNKDPDGNAFFDTVVGANGGLSPNIGTQVIYQADSGVDDVTLRTNVGDLPNEAFVHLHDVPTIVDLCISKKETCTRGNVIREREGLTLALDANGRMEVDAFLCQEPATGTCVFDPSIENLTGDTKRQRWVNTVNNTIQSGIFVLDLAFEDVEIHFHTRKDETSAILFDTELKPVNGLFGLKQRNDLLLRATLQPVQVGEQVITNGDIDLLARLELVKNPPLSADLVGDIRNFPNSALAAHDMAVTVHGANPSFFPGLVCIDATEIDFTAAGLLNLDLAQELCLPSD